MPEILIRFYTIRENLLNKVDFFFFIRYYLDRLYTIQKLLLLGDECL